MSPWSLAGSLCFNAKTIPLRVKFSGSFFQLVHSNRWGEGAILLRCALYSWRKIFSLCHLNKNDCKPPQQCDWMCKHNANQLLAVETTTNYKLGASWDTAARPVPNFNCKESFVGLDQWTNSYGYSCGIILQCKKIFMKMFKNVTVYLLFRGFLCFL